jgi:hypothetical protein
MAATIKRTVSDNKRRTTEQFIQEAQQIHQDKYRYSQSIYKNANNKVAITCLVHGEFEQIPADHLRGMGCRKCGAELRGNKRRTGQGEFIDRATKVHKGFYQYEYIDYKGTDSKVRITCPKHGDFLQSPHSHLKGSGCKECRKELISKIMTIPVEDFLDRAKETHGDRYEYTVSQYKNLESRIKINCREHGDFYQTARMHVKGQGCPRCGVESGGRIIRSNTEEFIYQANILHEGKYDYSLTKYSLSSEKLTVICSRHGAFKQKPNDHLDGHGCPSCGVTISTTETKLFDAVREIHPDALNNDRSGVAGIGVKLPLELDIYIPSASLAIEVNGLRWHSSMQQDRQGRDWVINHQKKKLEACKANGVQLLNFYEDEINNQFDIVLNMVKSKLRSKSPSTYARNTTVQNLNWEQAEDFLDNTHIQGSGRPAQAKGLFNKANQLIALMVFGRTQSIRGNKTEGVYEVLRYTSSEQVVGGCSKLLKAFLRETPEATSVISYADKRFSTGDMYKAIGFTLAYETPPDYCYVYKNSRRHKSGFRRASLEKLLPNFDPLLTEEANCRNHKIFQLYGCGLQKWELIL